MLPPAAAHVFAEDLDAPALTPEDHHHLRDVLRLRVGEDVSVADGSGRWRLFRVAEVAPALRLDAASDVGAEDPLVPRVTIAFAVTKGERPDWTVQKLTEVGVDAIVPLITQRSVVRWDADKAGRNLERFRRIAREAAMQSRRTRLPDVLPMTAFADAAALPGAALAHADGVPPELALPTLLVGPEGGWAPEELAVDCPRVALGGTVLRSETAAVAAAVLLCGLRAGIVAPSGGTG